MQISLTHQHEVFATYFDLGFVLGIEQHPIADLDGAHIGSHRCDSRPRQPIRSCSIRIGSLSSYDAEFFVTTVKPTVPITPEGRSIDRTCPLRHQQPGRFHKWIGTYRRKMMHSGISNDHAASSSPAFGLVPLGGSGIGALEQTIHSGYSPVRPSMRSRSRSAWPLCLAYSSIMCTKTQRTDMSTCSR
jgi:hypothetical protein